MLNQGYLKWTVLLSDDELLMNFETRDESRKLKKNKKKKYEIKKSAL